MLVLNVKGLIFGARWLYTPLQNARLFVCVHRAAVMVFGREIGHEVGGLGSDSGCTVYRLLIVLLIVFICGVSVLLMVSDQFLGCSDESDY